MSITVIGAGIQGISTAIALESAGYDTEIVSEKFSYLDGEDQKSVTTNYAAASVFPVKVEHSDLTQNELISKGESTYEPFYDQRNIPVRKQDHYKVYEEDLNFEMPNRMNIKSIKELNQHKIPKRRGEEIKSGYKCEEYFVEMPEYIPLLFDYYKYIGGSLKKKKVTRNEIIDINTTVINCSGNGSGELFSDDSLVPVRGHLLRLPYKGSSPLRFAYTYTPSEYNSYTYMYPRKDEILFGGTYLEGEFKEEGSWIGDKMDQPTVTIDGLEIPERLYKVNMNIIDQYVNIHNKDLGVKYGYRPYRKEGIRIEKENNVIHNYGHGGAGVTLSWWSAQRVTEILDGTKQEIEPIARSISKYKSKNR